MHKRVMALLLSLVLLLSAAMPVTAMAAEGYAGSFVLVAMNANSTIVEPTRIQYKSGQTIQQALADSDIDFVGLENGFVYEINGVSANYLLYYDKGGYKLDAPASSVKALCFHVSSTYSDAAIQLIIQMADYLDMTNHVQNYPAAASAYAAALKGLRTATADSAGPLLKNLKDAIAEYAALLDGTKYTVSATATQNGNAVEAPILSLTDVYGNVTTGTGSVQVIAGDYKFRVSDGGYNRTEGTLTVSADAQVSATLPYGEWFGNIRLLDADQEPYRAAQNRENHTAPVLDRGYSQCSEQRVSECGDGQCPEYQDHQAPHHLYRHQRQGYVGHIPQLEQHSHIPYLSVDLWHGGQDLRAGSTVYRLGRLHADSVHTMSP